METSGQRGVHVPPGEGESLWVVDDTYTFKDVIENTGGALLLFEASSPPQGGPPPHVHHQEDEAYYVLEGAIEVLMTHARGAREVVRRGRPGGAGGREPAGTGGDREVARRSAQVRAGDTSAF